MLGQDGSPAEARLPCHSIERLRCFDPPQGRQRGHSCPRHRSIYAEPSRREARRAGSIARSGSPLVHLPAELLCVSSLTSSASTNDTARLAAILDNRLPSLSVCIAYYTIIKECSPRGEDTGAARVIEDLSAQSRAPYFRPGTLINAPVCDSANPRPSRKGRELFLCCAAEAGFSLAARCALSSSNSSGSRRMRLASSRTIRRVTSRRPGSSSK
jgi:hypothetical protein